MARLPASDEFCGDRHPRYAAMCQVGSRSARMGWFRRRLFERDGGICQLCGHPVSSGAFHLDHIVPKTHGGPFEWSNLRVVHPGCNASRSHGVRATPLIDKRKNDPQPPEERMTELQEAALEHYAQSCGVNA